MPPLRALGARSERVVVGGQGQPVLAVAAQELGAHESDPVVVGKLVGDSPEHGQPGHRPRDLADGDRSVQPDDR